ncbi:conserved oligomeric Golgi complex subunit 3-like [Branchiostoma floridae]|uniref:Conserved oligomeric Golgi complex subunit 3 n=1 Tax=Branchiostoma floridae TaxID=7739 RepID=A0A9J7M337_BRAFL|nr:conserved oligomeric Golgi complex subunit 3-like [Branchiostoma floridae]
MADATNTRSFSAMVSPKVLSSKLGEWDRKQAPTAHLTERQRDSFMELTSHAQSRPLPIELPLDDGGYVQRTALHGLGARLGTGEEDAVLKGFSSLQMEEEKIENAQKFFSWFNKVESMIEEEEESCYRFPAERLKEHRQECDQVLGDVSSALDHLQELQKQYIFVSTKTNALHEACEHLLQEQTKLVNAAESINNKLSYFTELERISTKLNSPAMSVTSDSFVPMLSRIDECVAYINSHPDFAECDVYLARFRQCLSKALNLIKTYVVNLLQQASQQVQPKGKDAQSPSDNAFTLYYGKFRTNAPRVKLLMEQIEDRIDRSPEYQQLLNDCHQCYFNQRQLLLGPSVTTAVTEMAGHHVRDHCALVRSGCAFMVHVCQDEHQLFAHFFSRKTPKLDVLLEGLCNSLYDVLRPLIIHIQHLETLSELCSILRVEMLEEHVQNNPDELRAFETVALQMLEDVQERLVYRAHIYIQTDIQSYNPAPGDLAYPDKLEMMERIARSIKEEEAQRRSETGSVSSTSSGRDQDAFTDVPLANDTQNQAHTNGQVKTEGAIELPAKPRSDLDMANHNVSLSPADIHGMWYPTVRRTLVCLSKLYRCVDRTIFQGLSQEALAACVQSLIVASVSIAKLKTEMDGELFLIKHLLILREQITPFHAEFAIKEMALDFSTVKSAAFGLLHNRSKLFTFSTNNALLEFLLQGAPQVVEHYVDSKREVDRQLKRTCEEFIQHVVKGFVSPLTDFINKANVIVNMNKEDSGPKVSLRQQPFAGAETVHELVTKTYKNIKGQLPVILKSMALYLANKDTEFILFKPIKMNVQTSFQQLHDIVVENYPEDDQQIISCPSPDQVHLLMAVPS